ncbi:MAG: sugar ABC transporter permease [Caldilineaceae bacterium]|nr:sugar ABC transporter permease [Caldilineaceae bacterium]
MTSGEQHASFEQGRITEGPQGQIRTAGGEQRNRVLGLPLHFLLIAPTFLIVFGLLVYPLGYAIVLSFSNKILTGSVPFKWVGLENYLDLVEAKSEMWTSVGVTLRFAIVGVLSEFIIGLSLALLLNREFRGRTWLRVGLLVPLMVPPLASGLIWRIMYDDSFGIFPHLVRTVGANPPIFLGDPDWALYAVVATEVWRSSPFMVLVLLAALQAQPVETIEAAEVDGASNWQVFRLITLPFITPVIIVALLFRTVDALRTFDLIFLLTAGGPGTTTEVISMFIYRWGFRHFKLGFTSAASILLMIATLIICIFYLRMLVVRQAEVQLTQE